MNKPILMRPSGKDYIWGGNRLNEEFGKGIDMSPLAETWECSTHPDGPSYAASGELAGKSLPEILELHPDYLGTRHCGRKDLPVLIKFIDAERDLSVQVHPSDEYAMEHENGQLGKSEMWYVLDAAEGAELVYGFAHSADRETIRKAAEDGSIMRYLQRVPVKKGDVFYIEAGTVHAIGEGCLIAEIQESSNLTYRFYDYDRVGPDGKKRPLHIEKALDVADLNVAAEPRQPMRVLRYKQGASSEFLARCKYFEVFKYDVSRSISDEKNGGQLSEGLILENDNDGFRVLLLTDGSGVLSFGSEQFEIRKGDCIFVPAGSFDLTVTGRLQFLDIRC